jgi:hypothetical protein
VRCKARPMRKANNLTAICEAIVKKMSELRRLKTLRASTACYKDEFTLVNDELKWLERKCWLPNSGHYTRISLKELKRTKKKKTTLEIFLRIEVWTCSFRNLNCTYSTVTTMPLTCNNRTAHKALFHAIVINVMHNGANTSGCSLKVMSKINCLHSKFENIFYRKMLLYHHNKLLLWENR